MIPVRKKGARSSLKLASFPGDEGPGGGFTGMFDEATKAAMIQRNKLAEEKLRALQEEGGAEMCFEDELQEIEREEEEIRRSHPDASAGRPETPKSEHEEVNANEKVHQGAGRLKEEKAHSPSIGVSAVGDGKSDSELSFAFLAGQAEERDEVISGCGEGSLWSTSGDSVGARSDDTQDKTSAMEDSNRLSSNLNGRSGGIATMAAAGGSSKNLPGIEQVAKQDGIDRSTISSLFQNMESSIKKDRQQKPLMTKGNMEDDLAVVEEQVAKGALGSSGSIKSGLGKKKTAPSIPSFPAVGEVGASSDPNYTAAFEARGDKAFPLPSPGSTKSRSPVLVGKSYPKNQTGTPSYLTPLDEGQGLGKSSCMNNPGMFVSFLQRLGLWRNKEEQKS